MKKEKLNSDSESESQESSEIYYDT